MSPTTSPASFFAGEFSHGMDGKGRLSIPSPWRKGEGDEFYFFPESQNRFLKAMRPDEFAIAVQTAPEAASSLDKRAEFQRWFCSRAHLVTVDKQGRLVLPDALRRFVSGSELALVGTFNSFEVWNKDVYEKTRAEREAVFQEEARLRGL